ncbi:MAG: hypothetical protein HQL52_19980 [Magnetococcales bacterium]|nr:hypothetical protein [Magnetococcales bacterium]
MAHVSAGEYHTAAVKTDGTVWAWGDNYDGQLGDGTTEDSSIPVQVQGLTNVAQVAAGEDHTLALGTDGTVWAWGSNRYGQLGDSTFTNSLTPVQVSTLSGVDQIVAGRNFSMALSDRSVWAWGYNNRGQLGNGSTENSSIPAEVQGLNSVTQISAGYYSAFALKSTGSVWAWGYNGYGQLGDGTTDESHEPINISSLSNVEQIITGPHHSLAIKSDKTLWGWGINSSSQLGTDPYEYSATPIQIPDLSDVSQASAGWLHSVAVTEDGNLWAWGDNYYNQLGLKIRFILPVVGENGEALFNLMGLDRDGDGLPDSYEEDYGLDPDNASDVEEDLDGDGFSNFDEFLDFTDPSDPSAAADYWNPELDVITLENNSIVLVVPDLIGGASDYGAGMWAVEVQVTDRLGNFLSERNSYQYWSSTEVWLDATTDSDWSTWRFEFDDNLWAPGEIYSVTVKATDLNGNETETNLLFLYSYTGSQWTTELSLEMSSSAILQGEEATFFGRLSLPGSGSVSMAQEIVLLVTDPRGATLEYTTESDANGFFTFDEVAAFSLSGHYEITVSYNLDDEGFLAGSSASDTLWVGDAAGFAVIVQGRIASDTDGQAAHNKTTDRIYDALIERGFESDHIWYFGYGESPDGETEVENPSKAAIEEVITGEIHPLMNGTPAPFYLIMVDHGDQDTFYLDSTETLSPDEVDAWLMGLEGELKGEALEQFRVVVVGACYSGSFIDSLSGDQRIVVTSATEVEVSFKGPREDDGVRVGEYFLEELFKALGRGESLKEGFQTATEYTEILTQDNTWWESSGAPYFDNALQHPLLDDDGDGVGSNVLDDTSGDGALAADLYLGTGTDHVTNAPGNPIEILTVTDTLYLNADTNDATLLATVSDTDRLNAQPWVSIRVPNQALPEQEGTEQVELDLTKEPMTSTDEEDLWERVQSDYFDEPGRYEVYYFAKDIQTDALSPMQRSVVYKDYADNHPPNTFSLLSPEDNASIRTAGVFQWEAATDPDPDDPLSYTLTIAEEDDFTSVVHQQEELLSPIAYVGPDDGLEDGVSYHWRVTAVDGYGASTHSREVWSFEADNTNDRVGMVEGYVYDRDTNEQVFGATVALEHNGTGNRVSYTTLSPISDFMLSQKLGEATLTVEAEGYDDAVQEVTVLEDGKTTLLIPLTPEEPLSGYVEWRPPELCYPAQLRE